MVLRERLRFATIAGLAAGGLALAVGLGRALLVLIGGRRVHFDIELWQVLLYVGGWTLACWVGAIIWPLTRIRGGGVLIGLLGAACLVGAVVAMEQGPPWTWSTGDVQDWLLFTVLFGGLVGFMIERDRGRAV
jgi:hypothetical protein